MALESEPRSLPCVVCDILIGDAEWYWAAMPDNGPVHSDCFMSEEELLAYRKDEGPVLFSDGVNNCVIFPNGVISYESFPLSRVHSVVFADPQRGQHDG
jgi:hypothetical protein